MKLKTLTSALFCWLLSINSAFSDDAGLEIYSKMVETYKTVDVYTDTGVVKTQMIKQGVIGGYSTRLKFKTKYFFNGNFYFQWWDTQGILESEKNILKREDGNIKIIFYGVEKIEENMNSALSSLAGVTKSASYLVPRHLIKGMPSLKASSIDSVSVDQIIGNDKRYKYKLSINFKNGLADNIWLNSNYLITKLQNSIIMNDGEIYNKEIYIYPIIKENRKKN